MYEYNNNELRFWDGRMPFAQRVSIAAAQRQLVDALARARDRIDEEFGPRTWKWLDEPATSFARCQDGDDQGWEDSSRQGMTTGMSISFFPRLLEIAAEEVAPHGFTRIVDVSDEDRWVNIFNVEDGGYVGVVHTRDTLAFSMRYATGCRPETSAGAVQRGRHAM